MSKYSRFIGTGSYYPSDIRTNADLEVMVDTSDEWITDRTGIKERRIIGAEETAATMGAEASKKAIEMAGIDPQSIDMIVCATTSGRYALPSTACEIQRILGINGIPAFDVAAACAGYCYALSVADQYIKSGMANRILVIGSYYRLTSTPMVLTVIYFTWVTQLVVMKHLFMKIGALCAGTKFSKLP